MWFRLAVTVFCCFVVLRCASGSDRTGEVRGPDANKSSHHEKEELIKKAEEMVSQPSQNEKTNLTTSSKEDIAERGNTEERKVCYNYVGCFSLESPWRSILRPILPPNPPEEIAASIKFYSSRNPDNEVHITLYPQTNMNGAMFDPEKETAIMIHGFASSGNASWLRDLKDAYLKHVDANVMVVDWGKGAQKNNYLQVAGNTRLVARQLEIFVKQLISERGANVQKFHLLGHSLGAQICSYLAKAVPGIRRLTAMDPAQPGFEGFDIKVRLHKSDADFVDVIHTDARPLIPSLGFGMIFPVGDVDFYMNGAYSQPGCFYPPIHELPMIKSIKDLAEYPVERISNLVSCPHGKSYEYLTEALRDKEKCTFWGRKFDVGSAISAATNTITQGFFKDLLNMAGPTCTESTCVPLGFDTFKSPLRGSFVVVTGRDEPYCLLQSKSSLKPTLNPSALIPSLKTNIGNMSMMARNVSSNVGKNAAKLAKNVFKWSSDGE